MLHENELLLSYFRAASEPSTGSATRTPSVHLQESTILSPRPHPALEAPGLVLRVMPGIATRGQVSPNFTSSCSNTEGTPPGGRLGLPRPVNTNNQMASPGGWRPFYRKIPPVIPEASEKSRGGKGGWLPLLFLFYIFRC